MANIPADVRELPQGAGSGKAPLPAGALQTRTDFGSAGYGGAAPPEGESHRYQFTVHALDVEHIEVDEDPAARWWASTSISTASAAPR